MEVQPQQGVGSVWTDEVKKGMEGRYVKMEENVPRKFQLLSIMRVPADDPKFGDKEGMQWLMSVKDLEDNRIKEWTTTSATLLTRMKNLGVDRGVKFNVMKAGNGTNTRWEVEILDEAEESVQVESPGDKLLREKEESAIKDSDLPF